MFSFDVTELFQEREFFPQLTWASLKRAELVIGYLFPESLRNLLFLKNGGYFKPELESWAAELYGIDPNGRMGIEGAWKTLLFEWEYPNVGIPIMSTLSAGHDEYFLDMRFQKPGEEPPVIRIDNELDNTFYYVAPSLSDFLIMIRDRKDVMGIETPQNFVQKYGSLINRKVPAIFLKEEKKEEDLPRE